MKKAFHINIVLLITFFSIQGCATFNKIMVDPETGAKVDCSHTGGGIGGMITAGVGSSQCEKRYKELGYITLKEYDAIPKATLSITSTPSDAIVYAKDRDVWVNLGQKTPLNLNMKSTMIRPECYKVELDNMMSEEQCFKLKEKNRAVHFTIAPPSGKALRKASSKEGKPKKP